MNPESVYGIYEEAAGRELARLAALVPADQAIVEIGVFQGRSLMYLASGSLHGNQAPVYGVDPWNLPRPSKPKYSSDETFAAAKDNVRASPAGRLVTLVRDFSVEAAAKYRGPKIGLLHIDADHRYEGVRSDFRAWQRHLSHGAAVCFDDYHPDFPGVVKAVDEFKALGSLYMPKDCTRLAVARHVVRGI